MARTNAVIQKVAAANAQLRDDINQGLGVEMNQPRHVNVEVKGARARRD